MKYFGEAVLFTTIYLLSGIGNPSIILAWFGFILMCIFWIAIGESNE